MEHRVDPLPQGDWLAAPSRMPTIWTWPTLLLGPLANFILLLYICGFLLVKLCILYSPPRRLCSLYFVFIQFYFIFITRASCDVSFLLSTLPTSSFRPYFRGNQYCHLTSLKPCLLGLNPGKRYPFFYHSFGSLSNTYCPHLAPLDFLNGHFCCFGNGYLFN